MKIGDVSRHRRFADPARLRWYAYYRAVRFSLRMRQMAPAVEGEPSLTREETPEIPALYLRYLNQPSASHFLNM